MHRAVKLLVGLAVFGMTTIAYAQDNNSKKKEASQKLESKAENLQRAKTIDFAGGLGLPLQSLVGLGDRIDDSRAAKDPVGLLASAQLLRAAETASGKKAGLTSDAVTEEAVKLAKLRNNSSELATASALISGKASDELKQLAERAKEDESDKSAATKAVNGSLHVDNHSHDYLHIFVNGYEVGDVPPFSGREFHVHQAIHLEARGAFTYAHHIVPPVDFYHYDWTINGHHHPH